MEFVLKDLLQLAADDLQLVNWNVGSSLCGLGFQDDTIMGYILM